MTLDYKAQTHRSSWFTPAQCLEWYKVPYQFREIQIHWWDDPSKKPSHQGVVNYQANKTGGSVNYVVSGGRVTSMIPEENCAITTQTGNPYGIKLECSPYGTNSDYDSIGWLVAQIWKRRGKLPLVPHKRYFNTACPGTLDLSRIAKEAEKHFNGDSMIDANSTSLLRIGHSEVGGWPLAETHAGKFDAQFHAAWNGKDEDEFMYAQWLAGGDFRAKRVEAMAKYPIAQQQVETLTKVVTIKDAEIVRLNKEIEVLKAQTSEDTEGLNKLGEVLAWLLKRIGIRS